MSDIEYISLKDAISAVTEFCYGRCFDKVITAECPFSDCIAKGINNIEFDKIPDLKVLIK